jgi:formate-nitrite transporter family protein
MPSAEETKLIKPVPGRDHILGPDSAPVTLVEYGDYQCPFSAEAHEVVMQLREELGAKIRYVYRHFPLNEIHPSALPSAQTAEVAATENKFWEMHDLLYENQGALEEEDLVQYAASIGLSEGLLNQVFEDGLYLDRIEEDIDSGTRNEVESTPSFFINGELYQGSSDFDSLLSVLEQEIEKKTKLRKTA